jgi:hypothetical protein
VAETLARPGAETAGAQRLPRPPACSFSPRPVLAPACLPLSMLLAFALNRNPLTPTARPVAP